MGLLDFFKNQPIMTDPHANAKRLMGGAVQAPQAPQVPQRQSILPTEQPVQQAPSMTPYQHPQNIGSYLMGYDPDLTGINNVGMQNTNPEVVKLNQTDNPEIEDSYTTFANGQVLQGQGNNSRYIPIDNTGINYAFQSPEEVGGSTGKAGVKVSDADIPLSVITGDTIYTKPTYTPNTLLGSESNFGFTGEGDDVKLTEDEEFSLFSLLSPSIDKEELIRRGIIPPKP